MRIDNESLRAVVLMMAVLAGAAVAGSAEFDLRDSELILPASGGIWQVVSATLETRILRIDLEGRAVMRGEAGTFGITSESRVVTFLDGDSSWALDRIEGLPDDGPIEAAGVSVSLYFQAPRHIFAGLQLELVTHDEQTLRLPMSLPGALQARRELDAAHADYRAQRWREAADHYRAAAVQRPNHAATWRGLGRTLVRLRENREAIVALGHALETEPEEAYDQALLGFAILDVSTDLESAARALRHLDRAQSLGYAWEELDYFIGYASELTGDVAAALEAYGRYLEAGGSGNRLEHARAYMAEGPQPSGAELAAPDTDPDAKPTAETEPEPERGPDVVVPERPRMADADHLGFDLEAVADFGIERVVLERIFVGRESWILRVRPETSHIIGPGTHLLSNRGDRQRLLSLDPAGDLLDLTFGVPSGRARSVTLILMDPESATDGDCTFHVPGYGRFRELSREGNRALAEGEHEAAITAYTEAIRYRAGDEGAWWRRGLSHHRSGAADLARTDLETAAALAPGNGDVHALLGQTLLAVGEGSAALVALEKAVDLGADSPSTLLDLGDAHFAGGDRDAARRTYQSILDRFPGGSVSEQARDRLSKLGN